MDHEITVAARLLIVESAVIQMLRALAASRSDAALWLQATANQIRGQAESLSFAKGLPGGIQEAVIVEAEEFARLLTRDFRP